KHDQELQFSVTRRINRPNFFQLIPYTDYTDSLNITRGNPDLVPEFTSSAEASYSKTFNKLNTFLASVYYKHTNHLITRYLAVDYNPVSGKNDYINTFINANSSYSYGAEFTSINTLKKWWDISTNVNLYNSRINTDNVAGSSQAALWSVFGKVNNNFKLPKNYTIQLSGDFQSKTNLPVNNSQGFGGPPMGQAQSSSQGYIRPFYGVDIAFKKTFLKNNAAAVTLSFNDIFASRKQDQHSEGFGFVQNYYRLNNPQMVRLTFTYRFGKMDMSLFKRQNMKSQSEGMQGGMQGMQQ
ncbi:MAG TPA: outer membrane beta-barrel family protein, partial [Chitinophagaceae bacterium]|nr:outer membrane beta-barrel family protein [Chitinophagaceae bacterium]